MDEQSAVVNEPVDTQVPTPTDPTSVETKDPEVADPLLDILSSDEEAPVVEPPAQKAPETEEQPKDNNPEEPPVQQDQPRGDEQPLKPKAENRFQQLANENKDLRAQIEQLHAQVYKPQTVEELMDEGLSQELAEVRSLKQELEVQAYNSKVYETQVQLESDSQRVVQDFPIFDPESSEYIPELAEQARQNLQKAIVTDQNTGQIIGFNQSPYQIYKPIADAYKMSSIRGKIEGQRATEKMLANVDAPASVTPRETKKDPLLEILSSDD